MSTRKKRINFRIIEGELISQNIKDEIINTYKTSKKKKSTLKKYFCDKYSIGQGAYNDIIRQIPDKGLYRKNRSNRYRTYNSVDVIDDAGGLELIRALKLEGWSRVEIMDYFNVSKSGFERYLRRYDFTFRDLPRKTGLTLNDVKLVKEKYGLE